MSGASKPNWEAEAPDERNDGATELPEGWASAALKDIAKLITKGSTPTTYGHGYVSEGIPFVRVEHLRDGVINRASISQFIDEAADETLKRSRLQSDDVLFSLAGTIGRTAIVRDCDIPSNTNQAVGIVRGFGDIFLPKFLQLLLTSDHVQKAVQDKARGGAMMNVSLGDLKDLVAPIPPMVEQQRIVAKLELLLGKVSSNQKRLSRVPGLLKRFRQSVLAAACSGKLTADWREENPSGVADAHTTNDSGIDLPEIPVTWTWIKLPETGEMNRGKSRHRPRNEPALYGGPYPFIQTGDIAQSRGRIRSHKQTYSENGLAQSRLWAAGTICITIAANIAESAILTYPACFPDSVVGIITNPAVCVTEFVEYFIRVAKDDLSTFAPATAQKNINIAILSDLAVPLPPLAEQQEIVRRVEQLFAFADQIEARLKHAQSHVDRLTQSILAKAFRGELVPTEHALAEQEGRTYESAAELLDRIRRESVPPTPATKKTRKKSDPKLKT